jgi:hypothetical protein
MSIRNQSTQDAKAISRKIISTNNSRQTTGVDFAGPFKMRASAGRVMKASKSYISVFVCMVTKAVHLKLVSSLEIFSTHRSFRGVANQLDKELQEAF